jgi:hypothetical protein
MPIDLDAVRPLAADVLRPGHFFSTLTLAWTHNAAETSRWEVFQGRLLDPAHTRREATFETWNVHEQTSEGLSAEPILSLKLDAAGGLLHVVRGVECHVHQAYGEGNVIQTREVRRWVRELVATFDLSRFDSAEALREELTAAMSRAVTGTRLPLTPVEAPLPAFTFGRLFSGVAGGADARTFEGVSLASWWSGPVTSDLVRSLEFWLRATPVSELERASSDLTEFWWRWRNARLALRYYLQAVFSAISLSPWTTFVEKVLKLLAILEKPCRALGPALFDAGTALDFESYLLRLVCRHLTAYDLVTFHHRGANYPDALLLDAVLNDFLARLERNQETFAGDAGRIRRRALRQAYLLRTQYENHPVPDVPTSPGEHQRVLPDGYPRVPEEQILNPAARKRRLYENDPLLARLSPVALDVLRQSVADLTHADERQELGAAVFLDRPFGGGKAPVEPDATPLLASLAYSRSVAVQRLRRLCRDLQMPEPSDLGGFDLLGLPLERIGLPSRQGTVSLADAARAAPDFVFRRTLPGSVRGLREWIDFGRFGARMDGTALVARAAEGPGILVYDERFEPFLQIKTRLERGYVSRRGIEFPAAGVELSEPGG